MCFSLSGVQQTTRSALLLLTIGLPLYGCTPGNTRAPVENGTSVTRPTASGGSIDPMILGLDTAAAIALLDRTAAGSNREKAFSLLERAIELAVGHESSQSVDQRLTVLQQRYPDADKIVRLGILDNRILLARRRIAGVIESLDGWLLRATLHEKLSIRALKAEAFLQAGFPMESVQIRIKLDEDYQRLDPEKQPDNNAQLWNSLLRADPNLISRHISEIPDTFSGWLELAHIAHRYKYDRPELNAQINQWTRRNPGHPAQRRILERIKTKQLATSNHPGRVALILPLSGKIAPVGEAVRDGFMAAYLETSRIFGTQVIIDVYDSRGTAEGASQAVKTANLRGAQFIIGPLNKEAISAAITANWSVAPAPVQPVKKGAVALPIPATTHASMLILNRIPGSVIDDDNAQSFTPSNTINKADIYQFDLAPETEAIQAAERASLEGLDYAMVMVPENIWGNRIYEAFTQRYRELGGNVIALQRFNKGSTDFSNGIQNGLMLNLSSARHRRLKSLLHEDIEFIPRRRQDIDMVFMAASPFEARLIKPQLKFFYADDIPTYATSSIFSGSANPARDKDLEGVKFCDMPWLLTDKPAPGSLHRTIATSWPQESAKYLRFYALGADAFQLLPQLDWLKQNNNDWMAGGTGRLSLDSSGTVQRHLSWATFKRAVPVLDPMFSN